jgi:hypothetical protein
MPACPGNGGKLTEGIGEALVGGVALLVEGVRVDLQQDRDAAPGAAGHTRSPSTPRVSHSDTTGWLLCGIPNAAYAESA